jgi:RNA polymerase sigma factor (sigma-70 family)
VTDAARADDALQQTWLAALARAGRARGRPRDVGAWLRGVVRHVVAKERRADARRDRRERDAALPEAQPPASDVVAELEAQRLVVEALLRTDEPYRETLVRRWYRDEKPAAIAAAMGVPVKTVDTRLARGLERLRARLVELRGGARDAWCVALMPLAAHAPGAAAVVLGSIATGVLSMGTLSKFAAAALAAVAVWWGAHEILRPERAPSTERGAADGLAARTEREGGGGVDAAAVRRETDALGPAAAGSDGSEKAARLVVRVVDVDGRAIRSGVLALFAGERLLGKSTLDPGADALAAPDAAARLLVVPLDPEGVSPALPAVVEVAAHTTALDVTLPRGRSLAGRVECGGRPPPFEMRLEFAADGPLAIRRDVPEAVWRQLPLPPEAHRVADVAVDGAFRFGGLDDGVAGTLTFPTTVSLEPITREASGQLRVVSTLAIARPVEDLVVRVHALPAIVGELRDETGRPLDYCCWRALGDAPSGGFATSGESRSGGRFHVAVATADARSIELLLERDRWTEAVQLRLEGPFEGLRDLGEVRLPAERVVALRVVGSDDRPIREVRGRMVGLGGEDRKFEGDGAALTLRAPRLYSRALVGAFGWLPAEVELPDSAPPEAPFVVRLEKASELSIVVRRPAADDSTPCDLELSARGELFAPTMTASGGFGAAVGGTIVSIETDDDGESFVRISPARDVRIFGLLTGVPVRVRMRGPTGHVAFERSIVLAADAPSEVVVPVVDAVRRFRARVVDAAGDAVAGANVTLSALAPDPRYGTLATTSSRDGRVALDAFLDDEVRVTVTGRGFVPLVLPRVRSATDGPLVLRLARAWRLRAEVVDAAGRAVEVFRVTASRDGADSPPSDAWPDGPGRFRFEDLAPARAVVRLEFAGRVFEQAVEPPAEVARFVVPDAGGAIVRYDLPLPDAERAGRVLGALELRATTDGAASVVADTQRFDPPRREGVVEFPAVLPGAYEIVLVWRDADGREVAREPTGDTLTVVAGATSECRIPR